LIISVFIAAVAICASSIRGEICNISDANGLVWDTGVAEWMHELP
jgi:hypothetical protein